MILWEFQSTDHALPARLLFQTFVTTAKSGSEIISRIIDRRIEMALDYKLFKLRMLLQSGKRPSGEEMKKFVLRKRSGMGSTKFIGITGSGGKTTTARFIHHLISENDKCALSAFDNTFLSIIGGMRKLEKDMKYAVFEISGGEKGAIDAACRYVQPQFGIVTVVASDHIANFDRIEDIAREKGCLVSNIPPDGRVFLNADDPRVLDMRSRSRAKVLTYGRSPESDYRATDLIISRAGRLQFTCRHGDESARFDVGLLGLHFVTPALAAISCAHQLGTSLPSLARRGKTFTQTAGRCSLHSSPNAPVFICDTTKAPFETLSLALQTVSNFPEAPRRTIVLGTVSDQSKKGIYTHYKPAYKLARELADRVIFFGDKAAHARPEKEDMVAGRAHFVSNIVELRDLIRQTMIPGEIILLKGSAHVDHLERVAVDYGKEVVCWNNDCRMKTECFLCDQMLLTP
jgi:UDP-N-acetylmuramoyl-tripeptide--D-alanyl-D-alanine ligase